VANSTTNIARANQRVLGKQLSHGRRGGQRGRSGQNGAGNHAYTPEERLKQEGIDAAVKEMARPVVEEIEEEIRAEKKISKSQANFEKKLKALPQFLTDAGLTALFPVDRVVQNEWSKLPGMFECEFGHQFGTTLAKLWASRGIRKCPKCGNKARGRKSADARLSFMMKADEQGYDVYAIESSYKPVVLQERHTATRRSKNKHTMWPQNIEQWKIPSKNRQVMFVADHKDHVFLWVGPTPIVKHPVIAALLREQNANEYVDHWGTPALKRAIQECLDAGDKVVNLSLNDSWAGRAEYSWGDLESPEMATYMKTMQPIRRTT
jgi:hypothetical protein